MCRFIGKSHLSQEFPSDKYRMDFMVANEIVAYSLAQVVGVRVPAWFVSYVGGRPYFFSQDIDPRTDDQGNTFYADDDMLNAIDRREVALANVFNAWLLNSDILGTGRGNILVCNNHLYLIDFANSVLGLHREHAIARLESGVANDIDVWRFVPAWLRTSQSKLQEALVRLQRTPRHAITQALDNAHEVGLLSADLYCALDKFLTGRLANMVVSSLST